MQVNEYYLGTAARVVTPMVARSALTVGRTVSPVLKTGLNLTRGYVTSNAKSIVTNFGFNLTSQLVVKQNISQVDWLDAGIAGISGKSWGQVAGGITGGALDFTIDKGFVTAFDKSDYQLGVDVSTGAVSGLLGYGLNTPLLGLSPAWQNWGGFLNQMAGDGFNTTLNPNN